MKTIKLVLLMLSLLAFSFVAISCEDDSDDPYDGLEVASVTTGPTIDGSGTDAAWSDATALTVNCGTSSDYANAFGPINVTLKAVQDGDYVYFLASWADATENVDKKQLIYSGEAWGTSGNEDRIYFMFDIDNGVEGADCASMCHSPDPGKMWTSDGGEVDVWHWKAARTNPLNLADDKYFDGNWETETGSGEAAKDGGRHGDAKTISAYKDNFTTVDGVITPIYSGPITDGHFIVIPEGGSTADLTAYVDSTDTGLEIPGYYLNANATASGENRHQVSAKGVYAGGSWTVELKRALDTGDEHDADFVLGSTMNITLAVTDDSGGNHSGSAPIEVKF